MTDAAVLDRKEAVAADQPPLSRYGILPLALVAVVFALAFQQSPLYTLNQNAAFLRGLAKGGLGFLSADWEVQRQEALPSFTWLVTATYRAHFENAFYLYYLPLLAIYAYALSELVRRLVGLRRYSAPHLLFLATFLALHCSLAFELASPFGRASRLLHPEGPLLAGLGGMYALGSYFQPSCFGVLLFLSMLCFVENRPMIAAAVAALTATIHPTFGLSAAFLIATYSAIILLRDRNLARALWVGVCGAVLMLPIAVYVLNTFGPSSKELWAQATYILAFVRIPHHARPAVWFGYKAAAQCLVMVGAVWLLRRDVRGLLLAIPLGLSLCLTAMAAIVDKPWFSLMFPWRITAFLLPLSTCVILAWLAAWLASRLQRTSWFRPASVAVTAVVVAWLAIVGVAQVWRLVRSTPRVPSDAALAFARQTARKGDVYVIPIDLEEFRLATGVPIVADWKTAPTQDTDLLEWYSRIERIKRFYAEHGAGACRHLSELQTAYAVTHVLLPAPAELSCAFARLVFRDRAFTVYALTPSFAD
ncbi:MAG TPA: DUF6798 domain-containing protein [Gemmatimonadaceae bacterium]|nr:DUF6798 domain-containing protein [Gemmatimonadaceae bacterium]